MKGFAGPGIDAALIQHEHHVRLLSMTPIRPNHLTLACTILQQGPQRWERSRVQRAVPPFAGGKFTCSEAASSACDLDWTGARDTEMQLMRLPMPHSMRDPARRGGQRTIQMARSASLAAVPAIVSPKHQPHAVPPPTALVTAGCPAGWRGGGRVGD